MARKGRGRSGKPHYRGGQTSDLTGSARWQNKPGQELTGAAPPSAQRFLAAAGAIVLLALLLRIYRAGWQPLWIDEAFSWYVATTRELLHALLIENSPPFYYLLLRGWVAVAGASETALRLPSALAGTLFVAVVLWTGWEIFDARVALWSGGVVALAPIHIYYSQEARAYALLVLFLLLTHVLVWRALQTNTWRRWALVTASALLALSTHYFAILGLLPCALLVPLWPDRARWRRYGAAMLASGLCFLPWVVWSFGLTPRSYEGFGWIQGVWEHTSALLAIPRSLEVFGLGGQAGLRLIFLKQFTAMEFPVTLRFLGLSVLVLLGLWVAVPWGDRNVGVPDLGKRKAWLGSFLVVPIGMLWVVSICCKPVYASGRYDLVAFPAYLLLLGLALAKVQRAKVAGPVLAPLVAVLFLIPVGTKLILYYQAPAQGGDAALETAEVLSASVRDGDVVVFTGYRGLPVLYHLSRLGYRWEERSCYNAAASRRFGCRMYPRESEQMPGVYDPTRLLTSADAVREEVGEFMRKLRSPGGELWVAFGGGTFSPEGISVSAEDTLLVTELERMGLKGLLVEGAPGILRFRRAAGE